MNEEASEQRLPPRPELLLDDGNESQFPPTAGITQKVIETGANAVDLPGWKAFRCRNVS